MFGKLRIVGQIFLDCIFPYSCVGCGRWGCIVCETCTRLFFPSKRQGDVGIMCVSMFEYSGIFREILRGFKLKKIHSLGHFLSQFTIQHYPICPFSRDCVWLGVPTHKKRLRRRGFDHIRVIFDPIVEAWGVSFTEGLLRVKETSYLYNLDAKARVLEVCDAFEWQGISLIGCQVVIVDDVLTSGATLREISKLIYAQGATSVLGLTLGRVEKKF